MKILSITAGAAGMYCGSCCRDNALAAELMRQGHDVTLLPVYTPTRPDEPNMSLDRVAFGGISVYLQQKFPLFRHLPRVLDRIWDAPPVIRSLAGRSIATDPRLLGDLTISMLEGEGGALRREFDKFMDWLGHEPPPDIINIPNSLLIALAEPLRRALGRPVTVTLQGEELFLDGLVEPYRGRARELIRGQVAHVDRFIAVSDYCADFMPGFLGFPRDQVDVVPLGVNTDGHVMHAPSSVFTVGYFARIAAEKGLHVLAEAYVHFRRRIGNAPAQLAAAGYLSAADRPYLDRVKATLAAAGLASEFDYRGEVDRAGKMAYLKGLNVLSVPAIYDEPKGLFVLEAMASGVPVVQPRRGAFTEMVEKTGGGLLVDADSPERLADGLHAIWSDRDLAARLSRQAYDGVRAHYTIQHAAARLLDAYQRLLTLETMKGMKRA